MSTALYIGGGFPEDVFRLYTGFNEITVICSSAEQREHWQTLLPMNIKTVVADPLLIDTTIQRNFRKAFDVVYLETRTPALAEKAIEFCKPNGLIEVRRLTHG